VASFDERCGPIASPLLALGRVGCSGSVPEWSCPVRGRLEVTKCNSPLKWVRLDSAPFTDRLVRKFQLPVSSWRER
jgi:hypothetical protein